MKPVQSFRLFSSVILSTLCLQAKGASFSDGGSHVISDDSFANEYILVSNGSELMVESGALLTSILDIRDTSQVSITGGNFEGYIFVRDEAFLHILDGTFGGPNPFSGIVSAQPGISPTILIEGGNFGGAPDGSGSVDIYENAHLIINGGNFGGSGQISGDIGVSMNAYCEIHGGNFGGSGRASGRLNVLDHGSAEIYGGSWTSTGLQSGQLTVRDNGLLDIFGGEMVSQNTGQLFVSWCDNCDLNIYGCEFDKPFGNLPNPLGQAPILGTFPDGSLIDGVYSKWGTGNMTLVLSPFCISDLDEDGISDEEDNCPESYNPDQSDFDSDGIGDVCDPDIDDDGILNGEDDCPFSILTDGESIIVLGCDTGVINRILTTGCTLQNELDAALAVCTIDAKNHGEFVRCAAHLLNVIVENGAITEVEKESIMGCLGSSSVGKPVKSKGR